MILLKKPRAVLFDLDGTLADTVPALHRGVLGALKKVNYPEINEAETRSYVGNGATMLLARALSGKMSPSLEILASELLKEAMQGFFDTYGKCYTCRDNLYPGVEATIKALYDDGIKLGVLTNKPYQFVEPILEDARLLKYFAFTWGGDVLKEKKPSPEPFRFVCQVMKVEPWETVMVGDSSNDILGARNAGLFSIGLTYGYNRGKPISESKPNYVFDNFSDIGNLIFNLQ